MTSRTTVKLLIASPDPDIARLLGTVLPDDEGAIVSTPSAREALRLVVHHVPEVLYVDATLPDMAALVRAVRRAPGGNETLVVLMGGEVALPEADHHVAARTTVLELLDLARAERNRRATGQQRTQAHPRTAPVLRRRPADADPSTLPPAPLPKTDRVPWVAEIHTDAPTVPPLRAAEPKPTAPEAVREAPHVGADAPSVETELLRKRLAQELRAVEAADHWSVLALRRGAPPEMVARGAARMRERYASLGQHADAGIRRLASAMVVRVDAAVRALADEAPVRSDLLGVDDVVTTPVAVATPLAAGLALLEAERWAEAEAWFTAARDRHPGEPLLLAALGWAHANNGALEIDARRRRGLEFLELAARLAPTMADAHVWRAAVLLDRGERAAAREALDTGLALAATHPLGLRLRERL